MVFRENAGPGMSGPYGCGVRQRNGEGAARARVALDGHGAAVGLHNELDDAEAESNASRVTRQAAVHLVEAAEDLFALALGDANAIVFDGEADLANGGEDAQCDPAIVACVLECVLE